MYVAIKPPLTQPPSNKLRVLQKSLLQLVKEQSRRLHVQIFYIQGIVLDELTPRFDLVAH